MIANEKEFDDSLKQLSSLYEEGKDCLYSLPLLQREKDKQFYRLFDILKEMRDLAAINMQKLHFNNDN
jgi:hypothetical protein